MRWLAYELHFRLQHFDALLRLCFGQNGRITVRQNFQRRNLIVSALPPKADIEQSLFPLVNDESACPLCANSGHRADLRRTQRRVAG